MRIDAKKIRCLIAEQGITIMTFAERCGICRQNVSIILGRGTCELRTAGKLARGLGVPVEDIIMEEG